MNTAHPDPNETAPVEPDSKKAWPVFWTVLGAVALAVVLALCTSSCVGAPHSIDELVSIPETQFDGWRDRLADGCGLGAEALVEHSPANVKTCGHVATGLRALAGQPLAPGAISGLAPQGAEARALRLALGELDAWLMQFVTENSEQLAAAMPRIAEILLTCADAIDAGAAAVVTHAPSPFSEPAVVERAKAEQ